VGQRATGTLHVQADRGLLGTTTVLPITGRSTASTVGGTGPHLLCHGGVGGSIGWADLDTGVAVSICHNRMFHALELNDQHPYAMLRTEIARLVQAALARSR
jgi:CubicO group peptidase (beta-lactamase class C family)